MNKPHALLLASFLVAAPALPAPGDGLVPRILAESERMFPALVECRRHFHQHPELSNREVETAREIARRLTAMGYEVRTGVAGTGVVAELRGALPGPLVAWRADIDALPIEEQVDVPYRSVNPGVMHACGHDVHITVALGAAELLMKLRQEVHGTVRFIFQPAEEGVPLGEEAGASAMIAAGVVADPTPAAIFAFHTMPTLRAGTVALRPAGMFAAADRFTVTVHGVKSHGSAPHLGVDAVYVASQLVVGLQAIVARETDARRPLVVSVGSLHAGNRFNIIADEATLEGTVRALDEATRASAEPAMRRIVDGICQSHRARCELVYVRLNPVAANDPARTVLARTALIDALGAGAVLEAEPVMAAEDFAHFLTRIPGAVLFLGVGNPEQGWTSYLHTSTFRPDEASLLAGVRAAAAILTAATSTLPADPAPSR